MNMTPHAPSPAQYDRVTTAFHWLTVVLVAVLLGTAWLWKFAPRTWHMHELEPLHVSLGILFAAVVFARLAWRGLAGRHLPGANRGAMDLAAKAVHWLLYVLLALEAVLGFALRWSQGEAFSFFGLFAIPDPFTPSRPVAHLIGEAHELTAYAIAALVFGHAVAALYHHYVLRDRLMARMSPVSAR